MKDNPDVKIRVDTELRKQLGLPPAQAAMDSPDTSSSVVEMPAKAARGGKG